MAATRPSNPLALAVLTLLDEQPMHPYQMSTTLRQRAKEQSIKLNYGSLYSVVESLRKRGWVEVSETVRRGNRPERTVYAITNEGKHVMVEWLSEILSTPVKEFPQFEAALSLMPGLPVGEVVSLLEQRLDKLRVRHENAAALMTKARDAGMQRLFAIEHEYELAVSAAEIDFVAALLDDLRAGNLSGLRIWRRWHELRADGMPGDEIDAKVQQEFKEDFNWVEEHACTDEELKRAIE